MDIIMVGLSLFKHENTTRNGQIMEIKGKLSENIKSRWTDFIRQRTDLIHQWTGLIRVRIKPLCL